MVAAGYAWATGIDAGRRHCYPVQPHSSLDYLTPIEFRHHRESINRGGVPK
jgi:hypothetical protein